MTLKFFTLHKNFYINKCERIGKWGGGVLVAINNRLSSVKSKRDGLVRLREHC